jgi:hypothetical protein
MAMHACRFRWTPLVTAACFLADLGLQCGRPDLLLLLAVLAVGSTLQMKLSTTRHQLARIWYASSFFLLDIAASVEFPKSHQ